MGLTYSFCSLLAWLPMIPGSGCQGSRRATTSRLAGGVFAPGNTWNSSERRLEQCFEVFQLLRMASTIDSKGFMSAPYYVYYTVLNTWNT